MIIALESKGKKSLPIEYLEMKYREKMGMSITEFDKQPISEIDLDMRMMQIESEYNLNNTKSG